jgi:hypothetical protein
MWRQGWGSLEAQEGDTESWRLLSCTLHGPHQPQEGPKRKKTAFSYRKKQKQCFDHPVLGLVPFKYIIQMYKS